MNLNPGTLGASLWSGDVGDARRLASETAAMKQESGFARTQRLGTESQEIFGIYAGEDVKFLVLSGFSDGTSRPRSTAARFPLSHVSKEQTLKTKAELIDHIAQQAGMSKAAVDTVLRVFVETITDHLSKGEEIGYPGLGKFEARLLPERKARNLHTGEEIVVPEQYAPRFRAAKALKDAMPKPPAKKGKKAAK